MPQSVVKMLRLFKRHILIPLLLTVFAVSFTAEAAPNKWESLKTERTDAKTIVKETEIEIKTASSTIIVTSNHSVQIKIFTILGRLVSSDSLPPGTNQLTLPAHGVYLVKIGNLTCKVAV
ncbi:MAG: T9SS type A sorting domain-containing protein [Muribaculaceae bacterium]|nr:T9SS type A sorting domain-containing protein [Muribaculaceae bacterium]